MKSNKNKSCFISFLIFLFIFSFVKINFSNELNFDKDIDNKSLKTTASEITILTPENKIYKKPMYGYYPGTNSFDNDDIGSEPSWFQEVKTIGGDVQVLEELDGHYNIVELYDTNNSDNALVGKDLFALPVNGSIEYWMRTDNSSNVCGFVLNGGIVTEVLIGIRAYNNELQRYNGTDWLNFGHSNGTDWHIPSIKNNKWYHIRIDFECSTGNYSGLDQHTWKLYLDGGISLGPFPFVNTKAFAHRINWYTDWLFNVSNYSYFLDAIGFSWTDLYNVADNRNQGLLLNFQAPSNLTWIGYSLDGNANITIMGNTTIPKPGNGFHNIQISGEDSGTNVYESNVINFQVNNPTLLLFTPWDGRAHGMYALVQANLIDNNQNGVSDFRDYYGITNIKMVNFYDAHTNRTEFDGLDENSSTKELANAVKNYILNLYSEGMIKDRLDIWAYSFGGLVARSMIKEFYGDLLNTGIIINHVAISGTPNHGLWFMVKAVINNDFTITKEEWQQTNFQMYPLSDFMMDLNSGDETPYEIIYSTYSGITVLDNFTMSIDDIYEIIMLNYSEYIDEIKQLIDKIRGIIGIYYDGFSTTHSTPLTGAKNRFYFPSTHKLLGGIPYLLTDILTDLKFYPKAEIKLINPQNQTFYGPMKGYYPATCGFENDIIGIKPIWFEDIGTEGGTVKVIEELGDHNKVMEISDASSGILNSHVRKNLTTTPSYGSIEYWMRTDNAGKLCGFRIDQGSQLNEMVNLRTFFNFLQYYNGTDWKNIKIVLDNTWYHIRVDFECTTGAYQGLSQYSWRTFVDGVQYGDYSFINNRNTASRLVWYNDHLHLMSGYKYYIDGIGLSWDSDYSIGDNLNEGLLLSFYKNIPHKWINYTINGIDSKNILGNTTIPMLPDGHHFIQVKYQDFSGEVIQSENTYFSVDTMLPDIQISTPVNYSLFGKSAPTLNISIIESNLYNMWYTLDDGITNVTFTNQFLLIDQAEWNKIGNGTAEVRIYAIDSGGYENYAEIIIRKDIIAPILTVFDPSPDETFKIPPNYNISIEEFSGIESIWFTFDGGLNNNTLTELVGTIDSLLWGQIPDGCVSIRFYAKDKAGNIGYTDITISKESPRGSGAIPGYGVGIFYGIICLCSVIIAKKMVRNKTKFQNS